MNQPLAQSGKPGPMTTKAWPLKSNSHPSLAPNLPIVCSTTWNAPQFALKPSSTSRETSPSLSNMSEINISSNGHGLMSINPEHYFNRELSWLEFNQRVLDQATSPRVPLLERLKFLSITASNLDEFFMVRVGGLKLQQTRAVASTDTAGMSISAQISAITDRTRKMVADQYACFNSEIEPSLAEAGINRIKMSEASVRHREAATRIFEEEIYPVLSPMAVDPEREFPLLVNLMLHVCVELAAPKLDPPRRFAVIPLGRVLPASSPCQPNVASHLPCSKMSSPG